MFNKSKLKGNKDCILYLENMYRVHSFAHINSFELSSKLISIPTLYVANMKETFRSPVRMRFHSKDIQFGQLLTIYLMTLKLNQI